MTSVKVVACLAVIGLLGGIVFTQEVPKDKPPKTDAGAASPGAKPATYKVEKKPFTIELTVKGILEAEETAEISYRPLPMANPPFGQAPLTIRQIVGHGVKVKKGDELVVFDTTQLDEIIKDLQVEKDVLAANIKVAEEELPLAQKSAPVELAAAETAKKRADEDLKYFLEVGRPQAEKEAHFMVKSSKYWLEYSQEELRQLEKMYKANDLTEETEKIILRRQKQMVEMATFFYQEAQIQRDYVLKFSLPNREKGLKETQAKQDLQLERARQTLGPQADQKREALAKMRSDRDKNLRRLEKLAKDQEAMTVRAPMDGVVYHGRFRKGQWTASTSLENKLVPHGTVTPNEVFLTVVKPRPVVVHLAIEEKDVHLVKPGLEGKAKFLVNPDRKLSARVTRLSPVPASPGKFDAQVTLDIDAADTSLMPGMACSVKFVPYAKKDALTVPAAAVREEDDKCFVEVVLKNGKRQRREVTPGRSDGETTEIVSGLHEGDEIVPERPGKKPSEGSPAASPVKEKGDLP